MQVRGKVKLKEKGGYYVGARGRSFVFCIKEIMVIEEAFGGMYIGEESGGTVRVSEYLFELQLVVPA